MLESLRQTNIGTLNLEEPKAPGYLFDAKREVSDVQWDLMQESLSTGPIESWLELASSMKLLFPDRVTVDVAKWKEIMEYLYHTGTRRVNPPTSTALATLSKAKIIFESENIQRVIKTFYLYDVHHDTALELLAKAKSLENRLAYASNIAILTAQAQPVIIDDHFMEEIGVLKEYDRDIEVDYLSMARLANPAYKPNLDQKTWLDMHRELQNLRQNGLTVSFAQMAASMKILSAEEVRLTPTGVELIMPIPKPDFRNVIPALPEVRKF